MIISGSIFAQKIDSVYFRQKEDMLYHLHDTIEQLSPPEKLKAEYAFRDSLSIILKNPQSVNYTFPNLKFVGRIASDDKNLNVFTWNIPQPGGFNNYYCILQYLPKKSKEIYVYVLKENPAILNKNQQARGDIKNWPGGLYYEVITQKYKGQTYYTLLGFHFNNILSNFKTIEVLTFNDQNIPFFPQGKFLYMGKSLNRIVFEFNERVQMTLKYNKAMKMIVFDHLSPSRPSLEGQYQFYGPDFSYDGLIFEDGIWKYQSDIQIKY